MGKPSAERRLEDNEASAFLRALRISPRKLNLVAQMIRGKPAATPPSLNASMMRYTKAGPLPLSPVTASSSDSLS